MSITYAGPWGQRSSAPSGTQKVRHPQNHTHKYLPEKVRDNLEDFDIQYWKVGRGSQGSDSSYYFVSYSEREEAED